jgi:hypothetical protein
MALKKSEKRLLMILGMAVAFFLLDRFVLSSGSKKPAKGKSTVSKASVLGTAAVAGGSGSTVSVQPTKSDTAPKVYEGWGRDPFVLPGSVTGAGTTSASKAKSESQPVLPKLKGMFWKEGRAYVLIDDAVLGEGEEKKGIRVEKINGMEVLCRQGNRQFTLHWRESP